MSGTRSRSPCPSISRPRCPSPAAWARARPASSPASWPRPRSPATRSTAPSSSASPPPSRAIRQRRARHPRRRRLLVHPRRGPSPLPALRGVRPPALHHHHPALRGPYERGAQGRAPADPAVERRMADGPHRRHDARSGDRRHRPDRRRQRRSPAGALSPTAHSRLRRDSPHVPCRRRQDAVDLRLGLHAHGRDRRHHRRQVPAGEAAGELPRLRDAYPDVRHGRRPDRVPVISGRRGGMHIRYRP